MLFERNDRRIIGSFANISDARRAVQALRAAGFTDSEVHLVEHEPYGDSGVPADTHRRGFFSRLFGVDDDAAQSYDCSVIGTRDDTSGRYFADAYSAQRTLVLVDANGRSDAVTILRNAGAEVNERAGTAFNEKLDEVRTMLLHEEQLEATKEVVEAGEVSIRKEVVTETRTIDVPLRHEEVVIERRPLGAGEAVATRTTLEPGEEVRVRVQDENVRVEKRTVPVEEVSIRKEAVEETRRVSDEVRREEARVEKTGEVKVRDSARGKARGRTTPPPLPEERSGV